ncbi:hypothetical protein HUJ05_012893 [Dendroctonus ponderosae]|nr:hypothetical protein HUJ05_012893 [Dendroctonus ponderosae]
MYGESCKLNKQTGKQLFNNVAGGTIVSNQSLVLQSITTARTGHYTCVGHNQEGDGESNSVQLDVKSALIMSDRNHEQGMNEE